LQATHLSPRAFIRVAAAQHYAEGTAAKHESESNGHAAAGYAVAPLPRHLIVHIGPKMMRLSGSIAKKITMPTMAITTEIMIR
jgi:hypothetical protein